MSQYKHRMTLVVPQSLIPAANQLALIAGESSDDVNTFATANYQDKDGNLYAVCSTVIKPIVLSLFGQSLGDSAFAVNGADIEQAQEALDAAIMYEQDMAATPHKIVIAIDIEPIAFFELLGVERMTNNDMSDVS